MGRGIALEMLERQGQESQPLWWLGEVVLSILIEPLDWLFAARDLLQGDLTALIGFLPLIPGSLRHIFDAATGLKIDDITREIGGKLDEFGQAWGAETDLIGRNTNGRGIIDQASGSFPPTGHNWLDEKAIQNNSAFWEYWQNYIKQEYGDLFVIDPPTSLSGQKVLGQVVWTHGERQIHIQFDLDAPLWVILHENIHVEQWVQAIDELGWEKIDELFENEIYAAAIKGVKEKEAYEFQIDLAKRLGLDDVHPFIFQSRLNLAGEWTQPIQELFDEYDELADIVKHFQIFK